MRALSITGTFGTHACYFQILAESSKQKQDESVAVRRIHSKTIKTNVFEFLWVAGLVRVQLSDKTLTRAL